jgi:hypothetical protein
MAMRSVEMAMRSVVLGPIMIVLARSRRICTSKLQARPLVREGVSHQEIRNFLLQHQDRLAD